MQNVKKTGGLLSDVLTQGMSDMTEFQYQLLKVFGAYKEEFKPQQQSPQKGRQIVTADEQEFLEVMSQVANIDMNILKCLGRINRKKGTVDIVHDRLQYLIYAMDFKRKVDSLNMRKKVEVELGE